MKSRGSPATPRAPFGVRQTKTVASISYRAEAGTAAQLLERQGGTRHIRCEAIEFRAALTFTEVEQRILVLGE
jgi:hypothetical protein